MTSQDMLQRYVTRDGTAAADAEGGDNIEDRGGWGLLRGTRDRCPAVEFRKRDDSVLAVPYATIDQFLFSPADGITVRAAGREIRVKGRHLNDPGAKPLSLFTALARGRVSWVAEPSRLGPAGAGQETAIESIGW